MDQSMCRFCGKGFLNASALRQHEKIHMGQGRYNCCGKVFHSMANLTRHRCSVHGEVGAFVCVNCQKSFATQADLKRHVKREDKNGFKCDICGITVEARNDLQEHLNKHSGEKKQKCDECGKVYRYWRNLSRHKKLHRKAWRHVSAK